MSKHISIVFFIILIILGTINHFVYSLFKNKFIAIFVPVNESIFEHMKLLFFPFLFLGLIRFFFYSKPNYFFSLSASLIIGTALIPILYYTYRLFLKDILILDLLIFVVSAASAEIIFYNLLKIDGKHYVMYSYLGLGLILISIVWFMVNTYNPPKNILFKDPIENKLL